MDMTDIIKFLIDDSKLSLRKFAEQSGIPHTTLHNILKNGCEKASVNSVIAICDALKVNLEDVRKLSLKDNVSDTDILNLKDMYIDTDNLLSMKYRNDLKQLYEACEKLDSEDILSLADAINNASKEDIELLTSLIKRITKK